MSELKTFWNQKHELYPAYEKLYNKFVPASGESLNEDGSINTLGELIRCVGRLGYEWCNNGNINAAESTWEYESDTCPECGGSGCFYDENEEGEEIEETCDSCGGAGEFEEEVQGELELKYGYYLEFIKENCPKSNDLCDAVEALILDPVLHYSYNYDEKEYSIYDGLSAHVVKYVQSQL